MIRRGGRAARYTAMVGSSGQIYEVADKTRKNDAREGPEKCRRPEGQGEEKEQVRDKNGIVISAEEGDGRYSEGIAVGQDLGAQKVELESVDSEEHRRDRGETFARGMDSFGGARFLVYRQGACSQSYS